MIKCQNLIPYDLPLTPYGTDDEAWTWDIPRTDPDLFGRITMS